MTAPLRAILQFRSTRAAVNRRAVLILCLLAAAVLLLWGSIFLVANTFPGHRDFQPKPFDRQAWLENREQVSGVYSDRLLMTDHLLERHDFIGWTRQQVIDLLGTPDYDNPHVSQEFDFAYDLGPEIGLVIHPDHMLLEFVLSDDGVVRGVTVREH